MDLTKRDQLIQYLKQHGLWAKKSLGQNFLVDREALDKIVEAAEITPEDTVLEIGPGLGTLTEELVQRAGKVIAIEKDDYLSKLLATEKRITAKGNIEIINADALEFEPNSYKPQRGPSIPGLSANSYKLVANIPYYITSKILEKFLSSDNRPSTIVLLVQKEVAERICAKAGGLFVLAVSVKYYGEPEMIGIVKRDSFYPSPNVDSAILRIRIKPRGLGAPEGTQNSAKEKEFFKMVKTGFQARRKTLYNNLKSGTHLGGEEIESLLREIGMNKNTRAQELTIDQWIVLAEKFQEKK